MQLLPPQGRAMADVATTFAVPDLVLPITWTGFGWEPQMLYLESADGLRLKVGPAAALQCACFDLPCTNPETSDWLKSYAAAIVDGSGMPADRPQDLDMFGRWSTAPARAPRAA